MKELPLFPFPDQPGVPLHHEYLCLYRSSPLIPVRLQNGCPAKLVTQYADVKTVLADDRFSRSQWRRGTLFARDSTALALVTSDPPVHSRRRKAVQAWFTRRSAEESRSRVETIAESLADSIEHAEQPVDLVNSYTAPLAYQVVCEMLGVPVLDIPTFLPWVTIMMSAGRFPPDQVKDAHTFMYNYFSNKLAACREEPDDGLISSLVRDSTLTDEEITVFGFGLLMAGGETTMNHLSLCAQQVIRNQELAETLRCDSSRIPAAVEEMLRWTWFGGTGGQPHVVTEDVELSGNSLIRGDVVIPLSDAANRDHAAFDDADTFRLGRAPNPHLGFGHGRHLCLGAPLARIELQVGLSVLLRRFGTLRLAVPDHAIDWRTRMFMRGTWSLSVTCSA